jgi:hypothetical protein
VVPGNGRCFHAADAVGDRRRERSVTGTGY